MKKTRMISLMALLLVGVMLFSSCGSAATFKLKSCLDGSLYVDQDPPYAAATEVADLKNAEYEYDCGDLVLFCTEVEVDGEEYDKYIVYNAKTGAVVFTVTDTETVENYVCLNCTYTDMNTEFAFFCVETTTYTKEDDIVNYDKYTEATALYNADGSQFATAAYGAYYDYTYDLIYFDGKVYRVGEDGKFAYAFDFSPLARFPYIDYATEDIYVSYRTSEPATLGLGDSKQIAFYDKELNLISAYSLPSYVDYSSFVLLENGDVLVQLLYEQDRFSEDYDFYAEGEKTNVDTYLLDTKKVTLEPIECAYVIEYAVPMTDDMRAAAGFNDKFANFAMVCPIVNKRVDASDIRLATVKNNGEMEVLEQINGMNIVEMEPIAINLWCAHTINGFSYLINEKGQILGDISNAELSGGYLDTYGKLYNYDLELVLDYEAERLEVYERFDHSILFENEDGELILFANGTKTTLIAKDADREYDDYYSEYDYFVIRDYSNLDAIKYEIYNDAGTKILTLDFDVESFDISAMELECDGVELLCVTGWDLEALEETYTYYRLG